MNSIFVDNNRGCIFQYNTGTTFRLDLPISVWLDSKLTVNMRRLPLQNMMLIAVLYHLILFIGDPILLGELKLVDEVLDMSELEDIIIGSSADGDLILDDSHECWVEIMMRNIEILFWEWIFLQTKDLTWGLPQKCLYLILLGGGIQEYLTVQNLLEFI